MLCLLSGGYTGRRRTVWILLRQQYAGTACCYRNKNGEAAPRGARNESAMQKTVYFCKMRRLVQLHTGKMQKAYKTLHANWQISQKLCLLCFYTSTKRNILAIFSLISLKKCVSFVMALYQFCQNRKRMNPPPGTPRRRKHGAAKRPPPAARGGGLVQTVQLRGNRRDKKGKKA